MRAIIIATKGVDGAEVLSERLGAAMLPLLDRPFLQHVVESLVRWGVTDVDFVLSHLPEKVEAFFGCGERWGCRFHYHLVRDPEKPYRPLADRLNLPREAPLLLVHGDTLPLVETMDREHEAPLLMMQEGEAGTFHWSGWAIIPHGVSLGLENGMIFQELEAALRRAGGTEKELDACLTVRDGSSLITATRKLLDLGIPHLMHGAREVEEGTWLSRDVGLHPTAHITPPVYIDEECRIGKSAIIGPYAVLGKGCVVDEKTRIENSVVMPWSYIGKDLSLDGCVVDKNCLVNTGIGSEITVTEAFIIGSLAEKEVRSRLVRLASRLMGCLLLVAFTPLLLLTFAYLKVFRKGPAHPSLSVVSLPALADETHWRTFPFATFEEGGPDPVTWEARWWHFFLVFLPGLVQVAKGRLRFVGLGPRTTETLRGLPSDWRNIYLTGKGGLITEAMLHFGAYPDEDELYAAETFYTVSSGFRYDLKLLLKYMGQLIGIVPRPR
jgi:carbonic anhydrase/acetyltransferase-like protein (isoleucine patch superfamily)